MPINITAEIITEYADSYLSKRGKRKRVHDSYDETVDMYKALRVHANGEMPYELINERRPSESAYIQEYRQKIYVPITKSKISKVISSLSKIRRSSDWSIKWPDVNPTIIKKGEELYKYVDSNFPYGFTSLTNWLFRVGLKNYLIDSNAVILVLPINLDKENIDLYKPFPFIFNAPSVLDFVPDDYAVLLSDKKCEYDIYDKSGKIVTTQTDGLIIHVVTSTNVITFHQNSQERGFRLARDFNHNLNTLPVFKMPGVFFKACGDGDYINESRINSMLPHLDEAARIYSDLQAEIVQHVHSEKWLYLNTNCNHCNGTGKETLNDAICDCHICKGVGKVPVSPYSNHVLTPPDPISGETSVPTPPAGYIQKTDVAEMCDRIDKLVKDHLYEALASINMQFLDEVPLNTSGKSKEVDRDELNNFVHACAEDLIYVMDRIVFLCNEYRIGGLIADAVKRYQLLPQIAVPEKFDLLSSDFMLDEIQKAKQNNINNLIISTLETDYAAKKFYNMPEVAQMLLLVFNLDPMPAITDEMKMVRLQNGGVTQEDYIISSNIVPFVKRALREDEHFAEMAYEDQYTKLQEYAAAKNDTAENQIREELTDEEIVI